MPQEATQANLAASHTAWAHRDTHHPKGAQSVYP